MLLLFNCKSKQNSYWIYSRIHYQLIPVKTYFAELSFVTFSPWTYMVFYTLSLFWFRSQHWETKVDRNLDRPFFWYRLLSDWYNKPVGNIFRNRLIFLIFSYSSSEKNVSKFSLYFALFAYKNQKSKADHQKRWSTFRSTSSSSQLKSIIPTISNSKCVKNKMWDTSIQRVF